MRFLFFLAVIVIINLKGSCQSWGDSTIKTKPIFHSVEKAPKYPGGMQAYYKFLYENLKFPDNRFSTFSNKLVNVRIYIDKTGKIVFAEIEKGVNKSYDEVALELIRKMPDWSPGIQNGYPVPTTILIPILFID